MRPTVLGQQISPTFLLTVVRVAHLGGSAFHAERYAVVPPLFIMIPALVLQLVLWTSSASAFYPYTPDWLKEKEEVALLGEAKRNAASSSVKEDGVAFIIEQRGDFEEVSHSRLED